MASKYQTLSGFLISPFHNKSDIDKDASYVEKYKSFVLANKIHVLAVCVIEDSYFFHIKVPSESQKDHRYEYDVVIRFFTDNPEVLKTNDLNKYYIQFFSNSPSFMYQYAYVYNKEGFLIEALYNKLDADYIDTPPTKRNSNMVLSYDKSIYFACRFLSEHSRKYLNKVSPFLTIKKVDDSKFFSNISDFKSVRLDQSLMSEEKKLKSVIKEKSPRSFLKKSIDGLNVNKKQATKSTSSRTSVTYAKKTGRSAKISGKTKISAKKSTNRH